MEGFEARINWTTPAIWRLWRNTAEVGNTTGRREDSGALIRSSGGHIIPLHIFGEPTFLSMAFSAWRWHYDSYILRRWYLTSFLRVFFLEIGNIILSWQAWLLQQHYLRQWHQWCIWVWWMGNGDILYWLYPLTLRFVIIFMRGNWNEETRLGSVCEEPCTIDLSSSSYFFFLRRAALPTASPWKFIPLISDKAVLLLMFNQQIQNNNVASKHWRKKEKAATFYVDMCSKITSP